MANYCNIDQYLYNYLKGFWVDKKFLQEPGNITDISKSQLQ
mgnify:CR=1 FL=1